MAERLLVGAALAQTALLPGMLAYDDLEGPCGAWQTLVDHPAVRQVIQSGGRVHIALSGGWFQAHLALVEPVTVTSMLPQMADAAQAPEPPC